MDVDFEASSFGLTIPVPLLIPVPFSPRGGWDLGLGVAFGSVGLLSGARTGLLPLAFNSICQLPFRGHYGQASLPGLVETLRLDATVGLWIDFWEFSLITLLFVVACRPCGVCSVFSSLILVDILFSLYSVKGMARQRPMKVSRGIIYYLCLFLINLSHTTPTGQLYS